MADTPRTLTDHQAAFADNSSGDIDAQALRDFLVSVLGCYGEMINDNSGTSGQTVNTTESKLTQWTTNGASNGGVTPDKTTNRRITVTLAGSYLVNLCMAFDLGASVKTLEIHLRQKTSGGTNVDQRIIVKNMVAADTAAVIGATAIFTCSANDVIEVYAKVTSGSCTMTIQAAQLVVRRVG